MFSGQLVRTSAVARGQRRHATRPSTTPTKAGVSAMTTESRMSTCGVDRSRSDNSSAESRSHFVSLDSYSQMRHTRMDVFQAVADPVRRSIVERLADAGEASAGQLAEAVRVQFGISQPTTSKHLKVLSEAGLVTTRCGTRSPIRHACAPGLRRCSRDSQDLSAPSCWP